jgi:hypothetical protein
MNLTPKLIPSFSAYPFSNIAYNTIVYWLPDRSEYSAEAFVQSICGGVAANSRNYSLIEIL